MPEIVPLRARYEAGFPTDYNPPPPAANAADAEIYSAGARLRDWARYLAKNSAIVAAILDARVAKGVGQGLTYEPMVRDRAGNLLPKLNDAIRAWHTEWSERIDVTGELARPEVERLMWRDWDTAGEVFARQVYRGRTRERTGYQLQLIPAELVPYGWVDSGQAVMGIDRDDWGAPQRYWVYPYAPSAFAWRYALPSLQPQPIPAEDMVHLRRQDELGQTRGVTLLHAVILRVSDIAEYQQSHRRAARASANLFASINRSMDFAPPSESGPEAIGTNAAGKRQAELNLTDLTLLDWLKQGESVNFHSPAHPNVNAIDFVNQELRQMAAACRVAFSWIAYVFDRAFAAQRMEGVHAWEMILEDRAQFVRDFAYPALYRAPLRIARLEGRFPVRELRRADPKTLDECRIDGPVMPTYDPLNDRKAAQLEEQMGWESRWGNIRRFGRSPAQVDAERAMDTAAPEPTTPSPDNNATQTTDQTTDGNDTQSDPAE